MTPARFRVVPVRQPDFDRLRRACIEEGLLDEDDLVDLDDVRLFATWL